MDQTELTMVVTAVKGIVDRENQETRQEINDLAEAVGAEMVKVSEALMGLQQFVVELAAGIEATDVAEKMNAYLETFWSAGVQGVLDTIDVVDPEEAPPVFAPKEKKV